MAMLLRLKSINFSLYISLFSTALLFFFDSLYFQMHIFLSDDVMFSFFSQRRFFSFWSFFSLIKDRFHLDSDFFPFTVQQFFPEFTGFSVINDERTVYHHHYYYYSACIGDFRFGYLRLLFLICCSYRSVSSLALRSPFVFNLFFTVCFDLLYFYVASLSLSLCVCLPFVLSSSSCIFYLFLNHCSLLCLFLLRIETKILFFFYYFLFTSFSSLHDYRFQYYGFQSTKFSSVEFEYHNSCSSSEASSH